MALFGLFGKKKDATAEVVDREALNAGLERSRTGFMGKLTRAIAGRSTIDDTVLDSLEEVLVGSDVGVETTLRIIERIQQRVKRDKYVGTGELNGILREEIAALMKDPVPMDPSTKPYVIMVVGVNGVGKTTTIGKLAHAFKQEGKSVVLGAADTFRAAAVDQLRIWSERVGVSLVQQGMNADPAAVAYDAVESAKAKGADVVIIDTAGRLHNKVNLMNELTKVRNVMRKVIPDAPHEVLLVLDASTGQNAIEQAREFTKATDVTALALNQAGWHCEGRRCHRHQRPVQHPHQVPRRRGRGRTPAGLRQARLRGRAIPRMIGFPAPGSAIRLYSFGNNHQPQNHGTRSIQHSPHRAPGEDKTVAIVAYLTLIGFIIAIILNGQKKTALGAFHLRQMLGDHHHRLRGCDRGLAHRVHLHRHRSRSCVLHIHVHHVDHGTHRGCERGTKAHAAAGQAIPGVVQERVQLDRISLRRAPSGLVPRGVLIPSLSSAVALPPS